MTAGAPVATVLIVDDSEAKRLALRTMLAPLDVTLVEAESGRAALRAVSSQTFAVILMDVRMPTMDGYETASLIRERIGLRLIPIIFVTAYGRDETETTTAYASGAVDFIFTPIRPEVLLAKVSAFVALFEQGHRLQRSLDSIAVLNVALLVSEARSRAVLQNIAEGVVTAGEGGLIESFNRSAQALFGYREEEVVGQSLESIIAPTHREDFFRPDQAEWEKSAANGNPGEPIETVARRRDGTCFPMEAGMSQMQIGEQTFTIGSMRDVSGRAERAAREARRVEAMRREAQRDRVAFDEAPIGSVITDRDGLIERVNRTICRMTGCAPDELIGKSFAEIVHPDDRERSARVVAALINGSEPQSGDVRYLHRSGRVIEARVVLSAIHGEAHHVTQIFRQIEDVTEARRTSRELEQAQFEILSRLAAAAELHDDDTGEHTRRVGELSASIAERLALPDGEVDLIRLAAPLHDVGKIAIPDAILGKAGRLSTAEFEQMKAHTVIGAQMLEGSTFPLVEMAERIALTHHEKWDGSGYPAGMAGDEIPIAGRIVAVADVFDALTHARPYKDAWSVVDAIAEIERTAGQHFDPEVVDAFLSLEHSAFAVPAVS